MEEAFFWIIGSAVVIALLGFVGIFSLWISKKRLEKMVHVLLAFAAGSLIGGAFFHLLPEALGMQDAGTALAIALVGFLTFLLLETFFHWHLCQKCDVHPFSYTMLAGDAIHNLIDGIVVAASFLTSIPLGITTFIAVFAHEFPQQLGIFGVLVKGGLKKNTAILYSFAAQSTVLLGALIGYFLSGMSVSFAMFLIPFAGGSFLYISASDLIPELHKTENKEKLMSLAIFGIGVLMMMLIKD